MPYGNRGPLAQRMTVVGLQVWTLSAPYGPRTCAFAAPADPGVANALTAAVPIWSEIAAKDVECARLMLRLADDDDLLACVPRLSISPIASRF